MNNKIFSQPPYKISLKSALLVTTKTVGWGYVRLALTLQQRFDLFDEEVYIKTVLFRQLEG